MFLWLIDRVGRKPLLYWGLTGQALSLIALGAAFAAQADLGSSLKWVTIGSLVGYIASFAISLGPIAWLIMSKICPLNVRGTAAGIATLFDWAFNFIVAMTFLALIAALGRPATFGFYAGISLVAIVFTRLYVPETKGVSLEEIEEHWRDGGRPVDLGRQPVV